jgi:predicted dehydrogenase
MPLEQYNFADQLPQLDQVVILGGGRWARVIAGVVCDLIPPTTRLTLCSPRGADSLNNWVSEQGLGNRISVTNQRPEVLSSSSTAVIVANAARDHVTAGRWAIERGGAVLVEKPFTTSLQDARDLVEYADQCGGLLVAGHVLRFARYLTNFSSMLPPWEEISSIFFEWIDSAGEQRYGEAKQYDATVPVFMDCLPHVVSVLQTVFGMLPELHRIHAVEAGGSRVTVILLLGGRKCHVTMQRNGKQRVRCLTVMTRNEKATLDFSTEPGVIRIGEVQVVGDNSWNKKPRPLASMLTAFLSAAHGGEVDARLNLNVALTSCAITDAIMLDYRDQIISWLACQAHSPEKYGTAFKYASDEFYQNNLIRVSKI